MEIKEVIPVSDVENQPLKQLSAEPIHIDEVCRKISLSISRVSITLAMMELKELVRQVGTMSYVLARAAREEYGVRGD